MSFTTHIPFEISLHHPPSESLIKVTDSSQPTQTLSVPVFETKPGFWAFRFISAVKANFSYEDGGQKRKFVVDQEYTGSNSLFRHGSVTRHPHDTYLSHLDSQPFFWLADTFWFGLTNRASESDFKTVVTDRADKGFTVSLVVVGYPPEVALSSVAAQNEGGAPFLETGDINLQYFGVVDRRIKYLIDQGIVPCIVGGWGYHLSVLGEVKIQRLWREIVARYAAYPVVFCLCGEVDLLTFPGAGSDRKGLPKPAPLLRLMKSLPIPSSLKQSLRQLRQQLLSPTQLRTQLQGWDRVAKTIKELDVFSRLLIVHPHGLTSPATLFQDPQWLGFDTLQSGHALDTFEPLKKALTLDIQRHRLVINLEPWYENILGKFGTHDQRRMFWTCILLGAKGHTYGAHGIWQMAHSHEKFLTHWGDADWQTALSNPGGQNISRAVAFIQKYSWWKLRPLASNALLAQIDDTYFVYVDSPTVLGTHPVITGLLPQTRLRVSVLDLDSYNPTQTSSMLTNSQGELLLLQKKLINETFMVLTIEN